MAVAGTKITGAKQLVKDLTALGIDVADLKRPFADIARRSAELAASLAPKRSGRLADSIRGNKSKSKATVAAGGRRVPYAGAINYGWPKRNIKGDHFMIKTSSQMGPIAEVEIKAELERLIREKRL